MVIARRPFMFFVSLVVLFIRCSAIVPPYLDASIDGQSVDFYTVDPVPKVDRLPLTTRPGTPPPAPPTKARPKTTRIATLVPKKPRLLEKKRAKPPTVLAVGASMYPIISSSRAELLVTCGQISAFYHKRQEEEKKRYAELKELIGQRISGGSPQVKKEEEEKEQSPEELLQMYGGRKKPAVAEPLLEPPTPAPAVDDASHVEHPKEVLLVQHVYRDLPQARIESPRPETTMEPRRRSGSFSDGPQKCRHGASYPCVRCSPPKQMIHCWIL